MSDQTKALALVQEFQIKAFQRSFVQTLAEQAKRSLVDQVVENLASVAWALQDHSAAIKRSIVSARQVLRVWLAAAVLILVRTLLIENLLFLEVESRRQDAG